MIPFQGPPASADTGPTEAALTRFHPDGWRVSLDARLDSRQFKTTSGKEEMDLRNFWATLSVDVAPWLSLAAKSGAGQADRDERDGEWGPIWGIGASALLLEHVMRATPVAGKKESIGLELGVDFTYRESNFSDADFNWTELRVTPTVVYRKNVPVGDDWVDHVPRGLQLRGGLLYLGSDGDFAEEDVEENRNFGVHAGAGWDRGGWTTRIYTNLLGDKEYEWGLGATYAF